MEPIVQAILDQLASIEGTGAFAATGETSYQNPGLQIEGLGEIGLPLFAEQAQALIALAHKAPFGKGALTITDTTVRSAWEIDAAQLRFNNPEWPAHLQQLLKSVADGLGIDPKRINANLYKLLIYEAGDFFLPHIDSEKEKGMFGTLVVGLPSMHSGGELHIRFDGREKIVDFAATNLYKIPYAAFFADCEHEIKPLLSGYRVVLVYNLVQKPGTPKVKTPQIQAQALEMADLLVKMGKSEKPFPQVVLLSHQYTPQNFSRSDLKLHDGPRAEALLEAAERAGYFASLGLVTHYQMGELKGDYYDEDYRYRGRRRYWEEEDDDDASDGTMGEVYEESTTVDTWFSDQLPSLGSVDLSDDNLIRNTKTEVGEGEEPIEKEAEGYTGNEGMTMQYWYHYGAVILWPKAQHPEILAKTGASVQLKWLNYYVENWADQTLEAPKNCRLILPKMTAENLNISGHSSLDFSPLVRTLIKLDDEKLIGEECLFTLDKTFRHIDAPAWTELLRHYRPALFEGLFQKAADRKDIFTTLRLLEVLSALDVLALSAEQKAFLEGQIQQIPDYLNGLELHNIEKPGALYRSIDTERPEATRSIVEHVLNLSPHGETDHNWMGQTLSVLTTPLPRKYANKILVKLLLSDSPATQTTLGVALRNVCITDLQARVAAKPTPPPDWRRAVPTSKTYADEWKILRAFLESPTLTTFDYRAAQGYRSQMESAIKYNNLDLRMETIRKGTPHTLRLTKTQAAYEREMEKWEKDVELLGEMED
jgi:hypothetical protein